MTWILLTLSLLFTGIRCEHPPDLGTTQVCTMDTQRGDEGSGPWP